MASVKDWGEIAQVYLNKLIEYLPTLIGAIALLVIGLWVIKFLIKYVEKMFKKKNFDETLEQFTLNLLKWGLRIMLFVLVITQLGVQSASLVAAIGGAALAVGLALQGSLANFAGGVLIIVLKPFKLGDWIEARGVSGSVQEISLFYTKINTFKNQRAVIPNGQLSNNNIINYSFNETRKEAMTVRISYQDDIKLTRKIIKDLIEEQEGILKDPAPQILVAELADSSVNFSVRYFAPLGVFWDIHWYMIEETKNRLQDAGITMPYPQRDVHFYDQGQGSQGSGSGQHASKQSNSGRGNPSTQGN